MKRGTKLFPLPKLASAGGISAWRHHHHRPAAVEAAKWPAVFVASVSLACHGPSWLLQPPAWPCCHQSCEKSSNEKPGARQNLSSGGDSTAIARVANRVREISAQLARVSGVAEALRSGGEMQTQYHLGHGEMRHRPGFKYPAGKATNMSPEM